MTLGHKKVERSGGGEGLSKEDSEGWISEVGEKARGSQEPHLKSG